MVVMRFATNSSCGVSRLGSSSRSEDEHNSRNFHFDMLSCRYVVVTVVIRDRVVREDTRALFIVGGKAASHGSDVYTRFQGPIQMWKLRPVAKSAGCLGNGHRGTRTAAESNRNRSIVEMRCERRILVGAVGGTTNWREKKLSGPEYHPWHVFCVG